MANGLFNLKQVMQAVQQSAWPAQKTPAVQYLVVAGGGGGGGAGGGGGGLLTGIYPVANGSSITVTVGGGGSGGPNESTAPATNGQNSVFGNITSLGGGKGGTWYSSNQNAVALGGAGGSGGGSAGQYTYSSYVAGAQGTAGQGNAGGSVIGTDGVPRYFGGGGGAGTVGLNAKPDGYAGNGGAGIASSISGTVTTYAGGGGGGRASGGTDANTGKGGVGGGGDAGTTSGASGTAGGTNTGGGGGGGNAGTGGAGGSGIVIVSYPDVYAAATATTGSPTVSTSGSGSLFCNTSVVGTNGFRYSGETQFVFGTGDFTIEFWTNVTSFSTFPTFTDFRNADGTGNGPNIYCMTNGELKYYNGADRISSGATVLSLNTWYHIALCRIGTATKLYLNGTQVGSTYTDTTNYVCGSTGPHILINAQESSGRVDGNTTNIRIVKGVGVYTGTFTPPTAPLTITQPAGTNISAITGTQTSLLLSSISGSFLADSSTYSLAPKVATSGPNPPAWNALSPFTGTGYKNRTYTWTSSGSITF